jgi:DNA-binding NtrC family response regulator
LTEHLRWQLICIGAGRLHIVNMLTTNARVLIAEGDADIRKRLRANLLALDVFSDCVSDGKAALTSLRERPYGIVILDLAVEKIEATRVIEAIGELQAPRPMVLATTGSDGRPSVDSELVQIVLRKPFSVEDVAEIIRSCIVATRKARLVVVAPAPAAEARVRP